MANLKVLIVDPDVNFRTDLKKQLIRAGVEVVGEADYGADAITLSQRSKPDAVAVAWQEPSARPEQTLESLTLVLPSSPLVVYSDIGELAAARKAIQAGAHDYLQKPDAVAVAWQEPSARPEQTLESLTLVLPSSPLVVYSDIGELAAARKAIQAGAHDYLQKPMTARELIDALGKAMNQIERRRLSESGSGQLVSEGVVIALFGAKGGIGKTTLSTNLAVALSQLKRESVSLMDIDTRFGDVAIVLDLKAEKNISDAIRNIDEIDRFNINSYLTTHSSGIDVLPAPIRPSDWRYVQPSHVERLIQLQAETHDFVILDTPGFFTELVGVALDHSDLVLLVTTLDISSIKDCAMAVDMLSSADFPMDRVKLVINHPSNIHTVDAKQVADVTGCEVFWTVPYDKTFVKSGQLGLPIVMTKPNSKGARSIFQLAQAISGGKLERRLFRRGNEARSIAPPALASVSQGGES